MWNMTTTGFTSAVQHRDDHDLLMVRARDRISLAKMAKDLGYDPGDVYTDFPSDYPFRIVVAKEEYARWLYEQALSIDYDNFKTRASEDRGGTYVNFLHRVWSAAHALTDRKTAVKNNRAWKEYERTRALEFSPTETDEDDDEES